ESCVGTSAGAPPARAAWAARQGWGASQRAVRSRTQEKNEPLPLQTTLPAQGRAWHAASGDCSIRSRPGGPRPHWDSHRESTTGPVIKFRRTALRVRIEHLWLSLPIAIVVWFGFLRRVGLVDFWWHLKAGEIIVTSGSIPRVD